MSSPLPKGGRCDSPIALAIARRAPCAFCEMPGPSDPHHFPPKGRGLTIDFLVCPACRSCHDRCDGQTVNGNGPIPELLQDAAVAISVRRLVLTASEVEWAQFDRDRRRWWASRGVMVPW